MSESCSSIYYPWSQLTSPVISHIFPTVQLESRDMQGSYLTNIVKFLKCVSQDARGCLLQMFTAWWQHTSRGSRELCKGAKEIGWNYPTFWECLKNMVQHEVEFVELTQRIGTVSPSNIRWHSGCCEEELKNLLKDSQLHLQKHCDKTLCHPLSYIISLYCEVH